MSFSISLNSEDAFLRLGESSDPTVRSWYAAHMRATARARAVAIASSRARALAAAAAVTAEDKRVLADEAWAIVALCRADARAKAELATAAAIDALAARDAWECIDAGSSSSCGEHISPPALDLHVSVLI